MSSLLIETSQHQKKQNSAHVLFAPLLGEQNPYQARLISGLKGMGFTISEAQFHQSFLPKVLGRQKADVIHLHWLHPYFRGSSYFKSLLRLSIFVIGLLILKLKGSKVVWTVHNLSNHENRYPLSDYLCSLAVSRLANCLITHSESAKNQLVKTVNLKNPDKVSVIPHGHYIDVYENNITQSEARRTLGLSDRETVFLFFGLIRPYKGILELIDAFKELEEKHSHLRLLVVGQSKDEKFCELIRQQIKGSSSIHFAPRFIEDSEVQLYMNSCDLVVLPYRKMLTSGVILLAMSFGRTCIAPRLGFTSELLDAQGAFLYQPEQEEGLQQAMETAINKKEELPLMGKHNQNLAQQFSWSKVAEMTAHVYQKALNKG